MNNELDYFIEGLGNAISLICTWLREEKSERVKRQAEHVIGSIEVLIPMAIDYNQPSRALVIRRLREQAKDGNVFGRAADLLEQSS